jgi:hypothetical protein
MLARKKNIDFVMFERKRKEKKKKEKRKKVRTKKTDLSLI